MSNYTPEQFARLPKWAQHLITRDTRDLADLREKLKQVNGEAETNVFIEQGIDEDQPMPKNSRILFRFPDKTSLAVGFRESGTILEVYGHGALSVHPRSTNVFYVTADR